MNVCFASHRAFPDGKVTQPFLENDPANIAYALGGSYFSFFTLRHLSSRQLIELFVPYDLVIVALDVQALELVVHLIEVCPVRIATYSEGHIADYQRLSPAEQITFLGAIRSAQINFLYWEKYVPFYRALTDRPVEYLPYPYLLDQAHQYYTQLDQRPSLVAVPSGFAGATRNGLASLAVAQRLINSGLVSQIACWLEGESFDQDVQALHAFFFSAPMAQPIPPRFNWRKWLIASNLDYRALLKLKTKLPSRVSGGTLAAVQSGGLTLYRRSGWTNYLAQLSRARILIDLNNRETVGRNALDCAALGIPCVSTARSDLQARLFPQTTLNDSWDIDAAYSLCRRLWQDEIFYRQVVDYAAETIKQFDVVLFPQQFESVCPRHAK